MTIKVLIPKAGMGTTEGTIARWLKAEGDRVREGEAIAEIENAKTVEEVLAPATGVLKRIILADGETADVFAQIAEIEEETG